MAKTPAWTRKEGKNPKGGLNAKGRASYNKANPGKPGLKAPQPEGGARKKSFCARMSGMKKKLTSKKMIWMTNLTTDFIRNGMDPRSLSVALRSLRLYGLWSTNKKMSKKTQYSLQPVWLAQSTECEREDR